MKCEICGGKMIVRTRMSGEKAGNRYYVCSNWPICKGQKSYAEQGKEHQWELSEGTFKYLPKKH